MRKLINMMGNKVRIKEKRKRVVLITTDDMHGVGSMLVTYFMFSEYIIDGFFVIGNDDIEDVILHINQKRNLPEYIVVTGLPDKLELKIDNKFHQIMGEKLIIYSERFLKNKIDECTKIPYKYPIYYNMMIDSLRSNIDNCDTQYISTLCNICHQLDDDKFDYLHYHIGTELLVLSILEEVENIYSQNIRYHNDYEYDINDYTLLHDLCRVLYKSNHITTPITKTINLRLPIAYNRQSQLAFSIIKSYTKLYKMIQDPLIFSGENIEIMIHKFSNCELQKVRLLNEYGYERMINKTPVVTIYILPNTDVVVDIYTHNIYDEYVSSIDKIFK